MGRKLYRPSHEPHSTSNRWCQPLLVLNFEYLSYENLFSQYLPIHNASIFLFFLYRQKIVDVWSYVDKVFIWLQNEKITRSLQLIWFGVESKLNLPRSSDEGTLCCKGIIFTTFWKYWRYLDTSGDESFARYCHQFFWKKKKLLEAVENVSIF